MHWDGHDGVRVLDLGGLPAGGHVRVSVPPRGGWRLVLPSSCTVAMEHGAPCVGADARDKESVAECLRSAGWSVQPVTTAGGAVVLNMPPLRPDGFVVDVTYVAVGVAGDGAHAYWVKGNERGDAMDAVRRAVACKKCKRAGALRAALQAARDDEPPAR